MVMSTGFVAYLTICVLALILHELGHAMVATATGIRIKRVGISWRGPYLVREQGPPMACVLTALAGPAMNLVLGMAFWHTAPQFSVVNLVLGAYNLLPFIPGLDGYNALAAYRKLESLSQNDPA
jgi:Zn-dependent protease